MTASAMTNAAFAATWTAPTSLTGARALTLRPGNAQKLVPSRNRTGRHAILWQHKRTPTHNGPRMQAEGGEGSFPLPPAGVLLLVASVCAISSIGCVFELSSGHPQYGVPVTGTILAVSLPGFIASYVAAIKKGQLEAEED